MTFGGGRIEWREVNVLEDLDYAVRLGVLSTPAIAINGKLQFRALPSAIKGRAKVPQIIGGKTGFCFANRKGRDECFRHPDRANTAARGAND